MLMQSEAVDYSPHSKYVIQSRKLLILTLQALSFRIHELLSLNFCAATEDARPSKTWDEWIFAESNRRYANPTLFPTSLNSISIGCLWFVICRVFTTHDYPCPGFDPFEHIPLSSPKTLWEARTEEEWRSEQAIHDISRPFREFGELVEARRRPNDTQKAQRLEAWEAGADKLGQLMNFAVSFI